VSETNADPQAVDEVIDDFVETTGDLSDGAAVLNSGVEDVITDAGDTTQAAVDAVAQLVGDEPEVEITGPQAAITETVMQPSAPPVVMPAPPVMVPVPPVVVPSGVGAASGAVKPAPKGKEKSGASSKSKKSGKSNTLGALTPPTPTRTRVRRVRLRLTRLDPLSVLRTSFLFAMAIAIAIFVVICVVWGVIYVSGALESIQKVLDSVVGNAEGDGSINLTQYLQTWRVLGFSALVSVLNVVLLTLIGTVCAYIYNLAASIYGGIEMTLAEDSH
jgi:hypothetical protein